MQVERVDEVELCEVREVDADELALADADRVPRVVEAAPVDGVEVVAAVAVRVVAVHHEDELAGRLTWCLRIDDERAVEAFVDVLLEWRGVAVVQVETRRPRGKLVEKLFALRDGLEDPVHVRRMDPVEVDRVRVRAPVDEADPQQVVLGSADHRAWDGAVVRPGGEEHTRRDLDVLVGRDERVVPNPTRLVRQRARRVEKLVEVVRPADRRGPVADHRRMAHACVVGVGRRRPVRRVVVPGGLGLPVQRQLDAEGRCHRKRRGCAEEPPTSEFRHA